MDYALFHRFGNPSTFSQIHNTRPNIMNISTRTLTEPRDFIFTKNPCPPIFRSNFCATSKVVSPVVLAHGRFAAPSPIYQEEGNCKTARISSTATIGASFALACALGFFCFGSTLMLSPKKAMAGPFFSNIFGGSGSSQQTTSMMMSAPISGNAALKALMDCIVFLGSPKNITSPPTTIRFYPQNVAELKKKALTQMKAGRSEEALNQMKAGKALIKDPEGQYQAEMALVEVLILQGKYKEASNCACLKNDQIMPSDNVRRSLYKAIIYTILDKEEAKKAWDDFITDGFAEGALPTPPDES